MIAATGTAQAFNTSTKI